MARRVAEDLDRASRLDAKRPGASTRVSLSGDLIARGQYQALRASIGAVGGVYRSPYYGGGSRGGYHGYDHGYGGGYGGYGYGCNYPSYYYPWGFGYYGGHFSFSLGFGWYNPCYSYWWPYYLSCWYPYWYSCYRPYAYYASYPAYYSSVVYRTVYVDDVAEGEQQAVAEAPVQAAPPAPSSLSIAADRYLTLGDRAFREGKYTDAVQFYAKAVEFAPDEGALYLVLADALFAAGDYHYGAYAIRRALELDPSLVDATVDKHEFYPSPEEFDHQLAVLETYLVEHPTDRDARLVLALNYHFGKRPAAAVDLLASATSEALRGDPAAELILSAARRTQFGEAPAAPARND